MPLYVKALVEPGHITWMRLIELMTFKPAEIVRSDKGTLAEGSDADITIIDPGIGVDDRHRATSSAAAETARFDGWQVKGRATTTIVGGEVKWELNRERSPAL